MSLLDGTAHQLSAALAAGEVSAVEVMQATLDRIAARNPTLNAIVSLRDGEKLLAAAAEADGTARRGWLHGIPIAVKDLAHVAGLPTSMGSPLFAGQVAPTSDLIVRRMQAAGAIVIGKTNTPEFGLGSHTYNPVFGATQNALLPGRSAGGSSGGAAVALAAGLVTVADGSDMMGSLRNPAGWNGVYGMRPTWGLVPSEPDGDMMLHQLSTNGPMARCPQDLSRLLATLSGPDARQPFGRPAFVAPEVLDPGAPMRIGWLGNWGGAFAMEDGVLDHCARGLSILAGTGCEIVDLPPPFDADAMWQSWCDLRAFAIAGKLGPYLDDDPAALKPEAVWEVQRGRALSGADVARASAIRSDWYRAALRAFETVDVLALPTAQCWPFPIAWDWPKEVGGQAMDTYHRWMQAVVPASLIGLPAVAVPLSPDLSGRPMGLQLIGRTGDDLRLLQLAERWHQARG